MPYVLGVDIGNSFTTGATAQVNDELPLPSSRPVKLGLDGNAIPSVAFVTEHGRVLIGEAAELAGTERPERVIREFRQRIGDPVAITIGELRLAAEDIYAAIARWVVRRAEEFEGAPADAVSLTYPADWGQYRITRVRRALTSVGLGEAVLVSEPEAAIRNYAASCPDLTDGVVAVYDLGGTSFDLALMRRTVSEGFQLVGEPGHLDGSGGIDFDEQLFRVVAGRSGDAVNPLSLRTKTTVDPEALRNASELRRECTAVKEHLSFRFEASVAVPGMRGTTRVVRSEFESAIAGSVHSTIDTLRQTLETAGLSADDLDSVLLVGGSSQIPLIARRLTEALQRPLSVDPDPTGAFASGAALAGAADRLAALAEARAREQEHAAAINPAPSKQRSNPLLRPVGALANLRFRPSPRLAHIGARVVPGAVAAVVAGLIFAVVAGQGSGFSALSPGSPQLPAAETGVWVPESLRPDGPLGSWFTPDAPDADAGADATPIFAPPPDVRASAPVPKRSGSAAPRQSAGKALSTPQSSTPRPPSPQPGGTNPEADPNPATTVSEPAPEPAPDPVPVPVPDPDPDPDPAPAPDPVPVPDPDPDPAPDPAPDPDPAPAPDPDPAPQPEPDPEPDPVPVPETGV